jgi:hypothetical protein
VPSCFPALTNLSYCLKTSLLLIQWDFYLKEGKEILNLDPLL